MHPYPHNRIGNILLPWDSIIHGEGGRLDGDRSAWKRDVGVELRTLRRQGL